MLSKRGYTLDIGIRTDAIKNSSGEIIAIAIICTNITNHKELEERLKLYEHAIRASKNGIVIADAQLIDNPITFVNPAFEKITGYCSREILGRNCRFLQNDDTDQEGLRRIRDALEKLETNTIILRNYRKDGKLFWNELTVSAVLDSDGRCTHYVGIQHDFTDIKELEKDLQIALEKEKELNELKSNFITLVSHEFRTPLTAIHSSGELLEHYRYKWTEENNSLTSIASNICQANGAIIKKIVYLF
ncbi:MAG: PAS domain S-box protein, partial [Calothrix sp. SM1_7_51]|nr:PAS domain S-box protein [Calothrix sp. SM1_7_51]